MKKNSNWPSLKPSNVGDYSHAHKKNFNLVTKESFFSYDDKFIDIKIPCPKGNFKLKEVYDFTNDFKNFFLYDLNCKVLVFHITDGTSEEKRDQPIIQFLDGKVEFKEILSSDTCKEVHPTFNLKNSEGVLSFIINDNIDSLCNKSLFDCNKDNFMRPNEGGGGVIVGNP